MKSFQQTYENKIKAIKSFDEYIETFAPLSNEIVQDNLLTSNVADIDKYLYAIFAEYIKNAGKRHRPLLCMLAAYAFGGNAEDAISAACAIENFHSAALVHDDIADRATVRRGKPAMHLQVGIGSALNIGDLGLYLTNGIVANDNHLSDLLKLRLIAELTEMAKLTIEGQAMDIGWAKDQNYSVTEDDYMTMATRKTAYYSVAYPLKLGAMIAGADKSETQAIFDFGIKCGLAFQIQDDILNLTNDKTSSMKNFRSDVQEGKRTLISVHALNNLPKDKSNHLKQLLGNEQNTKFELDEAYQLMQESKSIDYARNISTTLSNQANDILKKIENVKSKEIFESMSNWMITRNN